MHDPHKAAALHHVTMLKLVVDYALREGKITGTKHATLEAVLIAYLMGKDHDFVGARAIVESWEVNETFPGEESI